MGAESAVVASVDPKEVEVGLVGRSDLATVLLGHNDVDADDTAALSVARGVVKTEREIVVGLFVVAGLWDGLGTLAAAATVGVVNVDIVAADTVYVVRLGSRGAVEAVALTGNPGNQPSCTNHTTTTSGAAMCGLPVLSLPLLTRW